MPLASTFGAKAGVYGHKLAIKDGTCQVMMCAHGVSQIPVVDLKQLPDIDDDITNLEIWNNHSEDHAELRSLLHPNAPGINIKNLFGPRTFPLVEIEYDQPRSSPRKSLALEDGLLALEAENEEVPASPAAVMSTLALPEPVALAPTLSGLVVEPQVAADIPCDGTLSEEEEEVIEPPSKAASSKDRRMQSKLPFVAKRVCDDDVNVPPPARRKK